MRHGLIQTFGSESVFMRILRFVTVEGFSYPYAEQARLPGISFRGLNEDYKSDVGVVNPKVEVLRPFGGEVRIDHLLAQSAAHTNAVISKTRAAGHMYDWAVINGALDPVPDLPGDADD